SRLRSPPTPVRRNSERVVLGLGGESVLAGQVRGLRPVCSPALATIWPLDASEARRTKRCSRRWRRSWFINIHLLSAAAALALCGTEDGETRHSSSVHQRRIAMSQLLRFPSSVKRDPAIEVWMREHSDELGASAQRWFEVMRDCGGDVRELLHDGHPTACVGDAAFAYVNAFKAHVNVGFFRGAEIADPDGLLEGTGKFMRHVKLRPGGHVDGRALTRLIETAYTDMKGRLKTDREHRLTVLSRRD